MGKALFGHFCAGALISGAIVIIIRNGRKFLQKETNVMKGISEEKFDRIEEIKEQAKAVFDELWDAAKLEEGDILVVGCSSSEMVGSQIGKGSSMEAAQAAFRGIYPVL